jgi:hypothetical protein
MPSTRWAQVTDALLNLTAAQAGYRRYGGASGILVLDSIEAWSTDTLADSYLVIGWTNPDGSDIESGSSSQAWVTAGRVSREETGSVRCRAVAQPGTIDPKAARDAAVAVVDTVGAVLRTDNTLGLVAAPTSAPHMTAYLGSRMSVDQYLRAGAVCAITFDVEYSTRI